MAGSNKRFSIEGQLGTTVTTAVYTVPTGMVAVGARLGLTNTDASTAFPVTVHVSQSGAAAGTANLWINAETLTAGDHDDRSLPPSISQGGKIYAKAGTAAKVNYTITLVEVPQSAPGD